MAGNYAMKKKIAILLFVIFQIAGGLLFYFLARMEWAFTQLVILGMARDVEINQAIDQEKWQELLRRRELPATTELYDFLTVGLRDSPYMPFIGVVVLWGSGIFLLRLLYIRRPAATLPAPDDRQKKSDD